VGPSRLSATAAERRTWRSLASLTHSHAAAAELRAVELVDRAIDGAGIAELDEREPARSIGGTIHRKDDLEDLTDLREEDLEIVRRSLEAEVADEDS
jgi:hypothetical protein